MKRLVVTTLTLGCLFFDAECGIFSGNPLKRAERFVRKEAIPTVTQEVRNAGKAVADAAVSVHNEADRFAENNVIPGVEKGIDTFSREGKRILDQATDKIQKTGDEIVRVHNRLDSFTQKVVDQTEDKLQRIESEVKKATSNLSNRAVQELKDKSPIVNIITKIDDFLKQHPEFIYSAVTVAILGVFRASVENVSDLFQFLSKFAKKDL